jgi:hypothetical protein
VINHKAPAKAINEIGSPYILNPKQWIPEAKQGHKKFNLCFYQDIVKPIDYVVSLHRQKYGTCDVEIVTDLSDKLQSAFEFSGEPGDKTFFLMDSKKIRTYGIYINNTVLC